ncbi:MAG: glycoside hydrolase family 32 protein [Kiritimatiellia bacterium]
MIPARLRGMLAVVAAAGLVSAETEVFADFEGDAYPAGWRTTGTAFGAGPAQGTLPGQMAVTRFLGRGLVNSYRGKDRATGTLTSPEFRIGRPFISLLVGGGACAGKLGVDLVVEGKTVRTATGRNAPNAGVGVGEALAPVHWDVSDLQGRTASIRVYDHLSCGWGHINVDHICFADAPVRFWTDATRTVDVTADWLLFPVKNGGVKLNVKIGDGSASLPAKDIQLCPAADADWWAPWNVSRLRGRALTFSLVACPPGQTGLLDGIRLADAPPPAKSLADEPLRPQFHYSQRYGWNNDPNGMVYRDGEWHFFHQHNPYGITWGNMHWNHAVSTDLVHWTELGTALAPDALGTMFSGCGVVDRAGTAGFGTNAIVFAYTAAGTPSFTQCLAYSTDGRTLVKYDGNPVMGQLSPGNRDPKIFWHAPSAAWIMILYGSENGRHAFWIFRSPDLKNWTKASTLAGDELGKGNWRYECPGLEELRVEGENRTAWVVWGAGPWYDVGSFDGYAFKPADERLAAVQDGSGVYYAGQTFANAPDGRSVWIAWFRQPEDNRNTFSQSYSLPFDLSLRRTKDGLRLVRTPAKELAALRKGPAVPLAECADELVEVHLACTLPANATASFDLRGVKVVYAAKDATLAINGKKVPWPIADGRLALRAYLDRTGIEIVSQDGLNLQPAAVVPDPANRTFAAAFSGGATDIDCRAYPLRAITR